MSNNGAGTPPVRKLSRKVMTCQEAADEKGTDVRDEMKSLLFVADIGTFGLEHGPHEHKFFVVNVRGDMNVDSKKVKKFLKEYYKGQGKTFHGLRVATDEEMAVFGTSRGIVNPVTNEKLQDLPQLVSAEVLFRSGPMSTLAKHDEAIQFDAFGLLIGTKSFVGDFVADNEILKGELTSKITERVLPLLAGDVRALEQGKITQEDFNQKVALVGTMMLDKVLTRKLLTLGPNVKPAAAHTKTVDFRQNPQ